MRRIAWGALVHSATSTSARPFSEHLVLERERSPTDPLHLVLLMEDILGTVRGPDA